MGFNAGVVQVLLTGDWSELDRALKASEDRLKKVGERLSSIGQRLTVGLTVPLVGVGFAALRAASSLEASEQRFNAAFGSMSEGARDWSRQVAAAVGRSDDNIREGMSQIQQTLSAIGFTTPAAAALTRQLTTLAETLRLVRGADAAQAYEAIALAVAGTTRGLRQFGLVVTEDMMRQTLLASGVRNLGKELTAGQRALATTIVLQQQLRGDLGRTGAAVDSLRGRWQSMRERLEDVLEELGTALAPVFLAAMGAVIALAGAAAGLAHGLGELGPAAVYIIGLVATLAAAVGPLTFIVGKLILAFSAAPALFSAVAVKIAVVIAALAALGTWAVLFIRDWDVVKLRFLLIWTEIKDAFFSTLVSLAQGLASISGFFGAAAQGPRAFFEALRAGRLGDFAPDAVRRLVANLEALRDAAVGAGSGAIQRLEAQIAAVANSASAARPDLASLQQQIADLIQTILGAGGIPGGTGSQAITDAMKRLTEGTRQLDFQSAMLGERFDEQRQRAQLLESVVLDLAGAGVSLDTVLDAQGTTLADLTTEWLGLTMALEQTAKQKQFLMQVMDEGRRVTEETRRPTEQYAAAVQHLRELLSAGAIDQETFNRALRAAREGFAAAAFDLEIEVRSEGLRLGEQLIEGIIVGTGNLADMLRRTVARIISRYVIHEIEQLLDIASPSGVAQAWGASVIAGFAGGLLGDRNVLARASGLAFGALHPPRLPALEHGRALPLLRARGPGETGLLHLTQQNTFEIRALDAADVASTLERNRGVLHRLTLDAVRESRAFRRGLTGA